MTKNEKLCLVFGVLALSLVTMAVGLVLLMPMP